MAALLINGMRTVMPSSTTAARDRSGARPPIFSALEVLGFNYAHIGRLMGISTMTVSEWATGKRPLPIVRALALQYLVARLTGIIGRDLPPPNTRYARRAQVAIDAAARWCQLAKDELKEDTGDVFHAEDIERGVALGERMLDRLEAQ
jgi:DNA-binding transcriptional regulator YdaS (Cro superfamily)